MRGLQLPVPTPLQAAETILNLAKAELDRAHAAVQTFKSAHTVATSRGPAFLANSITARPQLEAELARLVKACDLCWRAHQAAMKEYARIKTGPTMTGYGGTPE